MNTEQETSHAVKLIRAREYLAQREAERGAHRYIPGMPSVLLPVMQRAVARVQERRNG